MQRVMRRSYGLTSGATKSAGSDIGAAWALGAHPPVNLKTPRCPPPAAKTATTMSDQAIAFLEKAARHLCVVVPCLEFDSGVIEPLPT